MHILLVEHNPERLRAMTAALAPAGHRVEGLGGASAALAALARPAPPDLVLLEERPPDMGALDFLQALGSMGVQVPVVLLGPDAASSRGVESTQLGAVDYVLTDAEGLYLRTLAARVRAAGERNARRDQTLRMADALASTAAAVVIADRAGHVEQVNEACARLLGRTAEEVRGGTLIDLFPLEEEPRVKADLLAALGSGGEWAGEVEVQREDDERVACIVTLSPIRRSGGRVDGLVLTLRDVSDRVAMEDALRAANRRLADQASRDALTGIYNRGYFLEVLEREMARAVRYGDVLSVVMIDLDQFKEINDLHGHAAGDAVLCDVARVLRPHLRDGDVLARYGGDEFCVLLPNTEADSALRVAERLCSAFSDRRYGPDESWGITLSGGLATSADLTGPSAGEAPAADTTDGILRRADRALYASKAGGGDRVTVWRPPEA